MPLFFAKDLIQIIDKSVEDNLYESSANANTSSARWEKLFAPKSKQRERENLDWMTIPDVGAAGSGGYSARSININDVCRSCGLAYDVGHCTRSSCTQRFGFGSDSSASNDSDREDIVDHGRTSYGHAYPTWAPALFIVDTGTVNDRNQVQLLRRGATPAMILQYNMTYNYNEGVCATIENEYGIVGQIYLGWNIHVEPGDLDGQQFMRNVLTEMRLQPELFAIEECDEGPWIAWMLVPQDQATSFQLTDNEMFELQTEMNE
jgi:hypothetical protein